jgi:putative component of toxin-antitoxin plasmid stabilization module
MVEVRQTPAFAKWFAALRDMGARARIDARIRRLSLGNPGDVKSVGVVLLCGGDKRTQTRDIEAARSMARELKG